MSEEEKEANELIKLYQPYCQEYQEGTDMIFSDDIESAKECALVCVDKILENINDNILKEQFYKKVKQIITNK